MKSKPSRLIITHLLGLMVGGMIYPFLHTPSGHGPESKARSSQRHISHTSTVTERNTLLALTRLIKDADDRLNDLDIQNTTREYGLRMIRTQPKLDRKNQKELNRLLQIANGYMQVEDLHSSLMNALVEENTDACHAIFLEWHRRDPEAAFDELALRTDWQDQFYDALITLHLPNEEIITQLARKDRTSDFKNMFFEEFGRKLGDADDLESVVLTLKALDPSDKTNFLSSFVEYWIPDDGAAAATFITQQMSAKHRLLLLEELATGSFNYTHTTWTGDFSTALFQQNLDVPEKLQRELQHESQRIDNSLGDDWPTQPDSDWTLIEPGLTPENAISRINSILSRQLHHEKDYPELLSRGEITLNEVATAMLATIDGADAYPEELARSLFTNLANYQPAQAVHWARSRISSENLSSDSIKVLETSATLNYEMRAPRLINLAQLFQPYFPRGEKSQQTSNHILATIDTWSVIQPEAAQRARSKIAPNHPIWEHQKKRRTSP